MSTPMTMTNCPDDNTLAAYIDGRLDPAARQRVVEHLSTCEDCYANVSAVWDYQADQAESGTRTKVAASVLGWPPARWVPAAVAASVLFVFALPKIHDWVVFQRTGGMSEVIDAQKSLKKRPMEGRLAGVEYKRYEALRGGGEQETSTESEPIEMLIAAARLQDASSAQELRALAAAQLFIGKGDTRDAAIVALEHAAAAAPRDPAVLNDRVVAYLARGHAGDCKRALELAQQAWQIEKTPEIAFNRALALQRNDKTADAIRAWQEYLALDPSSEWAVDANKHLSGLQNPDNY